MHNHDIQKKKRKIFKKENNYLLKYARKNTCFLLNYLKFNLFFLILIKFQGNKTISFVNNSCVYYFKHELFLTE